MKFNYTGTAIFLSALLLAGCSATSSTTKSVAKPISQAPEAQKQEVQCYQEFTALQKLDPAAYETFRQQFDNINKNYKVYEANKSLIDSNASEVMLTEINRKLSLVCVRVKNSVYTNMMQRANEMNKI
ncbi:hypothetical protein NB069_17285 [Leclercia adecarboxylata]|uniref:hypothetical protein n=1 Tax=Leclercia adecarboxylata TaxID=83655 RepID=UPI00202A2332|nr:hypothetical protein [Leclercia adecarboxylata]URN98408.1 hypothetical protein NB069_17285 [Leclercia adecarboxylata]